MGLEGWSRVDGAVNEEIKSGVNAIEDERVRELLTGITSARLATLEDNFQRQTGGDFALLNKDVTNDPHVFRALRELGLAHTEAEQDVAMANLINLVNGETDQETDQMDLAA